jgi:hypothetical protein
MAVFYNLVFRMDTKMIVQKNRGKGRTNYVLI